MSKYRELQAKVDELEEYIEQSCCRKVDAARRIAEEQERTATLRKRVQRLEAALKPFARFYQKWKQQPVASAKNIIYGIHAGTRWSATLRLAHCRRAASLLRSAKIPLDKCVK